MPGESKNGMQCAEFDALLSDALDAILSGPESERFESHLRICQLCGPLDDSLFKFLRSVPLLPQVPGFLEENCGLVRCDLQQETLNLRREVLSPRARDEYADFIVET